MTRILSSFCTLKDNILIPFARSVEKIKNFKKEKIFIFPYDYDEHFKINGDYITYKKHIDNDIKTLTFFYSYLSDYPDVELYKKIQNNYYLDNLPNLKVLYTNSFNLDYLPTSLEYLFLEGFQFKSYNNIDIDCFYNLPSSLKYLVVNNCNFVDKNICLNFLKEMKKINKKLKIIIVEECAFDCYYRNFF